MIHSFPVPFCDVWERDTHFVKHGQKFGAADAAEYERMADSFVFGATADDARDCIRPNVDRVRFGFVTHLEGIVRRVPEPECVRTFYPVRGTTIANHGGEAGYFAYECARVPGVNL